MSVLAIATAQAQPTSSAKSSNIADGTSAAGRKTTPSFVVDSRPADARAGTPVDLDVHNVRPANVSVGFAEAPAARSERASDPSFALSPAGAYGDAALLDANRYYEGRGPVSYRSDAFVVGEGKHAVDSVRVSVASVAPLGQTRPLALVRPDENGFEDRAVDVAVTRGWPAAVSVGAGKYALDVTPHAGLGFGGAGGSAEAGATLRFGKKMGNQVVDSLGVQDGRQFGQRGRWYLFAAASGQAVGLNMLHGSEGDWSGAGVSSDTSSKLVGDGQAGVAWRKGPMQASFGYVHRTIKAKDQIMGMSSQKDEMIAFSFSLRPHW